MLHHVRQSIVLSVLTFIGLAACEGGIVTNALVHSDKLGSIDLIRDEKGFGVLKDKTLHRVNDYDVDYTLAKMDASQLSKYLLYNKIKVEQYNNGDYKLKEHGSLKGGGLWGTTIGCWAGKGLVSVVGHGAILIVSMGATAVGGPALGAVTGMYLESTCGPIIETASLAGGIAGGILGGVATGPV